MEEGGNCRVGHNLYRRSMPRWELNRSIRQTCRRFLGIGRLHMHTMHKGSRKRLATQQHPCKVALVKVEVEVWGMEGLGQYWMEHRLCRHNRPRWELDQKFPRTSAHFLGNSPKYTTNKGSHKRLAIQTHPSKYSRELWVQE